MTNQAWSQDSPNDIVTLVQTILDASDVTATVFDGRALPGTVPPFANCWQLAPQQWGQSLAAEDWGLAQAEWQINLHGTNQGQARYLIEQVTEYVWPTGWELVEVGPFGEDTTDKPATWFATVTVVYRGMT